MFTADLLERSTKTFVQTFVVTFGASFVVPNNVADVNGWKAAGAAALLGAATAAISAVTSLLSKKVGDPTNASIVTAPPAPAPLARPAGYHGG